MSLCFLQTLYLSVFSSPLQENQELLLKSISEDIGFSEGKPVAACLIYKCLIHWRSFEVERTNIFNRIIETIASAIEVVSMFLFTPMQMFLTYFMGGLMLYLTCFTDAGKRRCTMLLVIQFRHTFNVA